MLKKLKNISSELFFVMGIIFIIFASLMNGNQTIMILKEVIRWIGICILCLPYIKADNGSIMENEGKKKEKEEVVANEKAAKIIVRFLYLCIGFTIVVSMMTDAFFVMFVLIVIMILSILFQLYFKDYYKNKLKIEK